MSDQDRAISDLQARMGYVFTNDQLIRRALTHASAVAPSKRTVDSYQRLEFLGDRILGLVAAELLHRDNPDANEGVLSRALNAVVRKESCAEVARNLHVEPAIILGHAETKTGGAHKEAILSDVCEAIIGALYLDGGLQSARNFIENRFAQFFSDAVGGRGDAKTSLQEWAQSTGLPLPKYVEVARAGPDHAPEFTIEVRLERHACARATGKSKKIAEHEAAAAFLVREGVWSHK